MMQGFLPEVKVFLRPGYTDMRKAINGLTAMAGEILKQDPFSGSLFAFTNRRRDLLKIVYWDQNGFCLWQKRLEKDRFIWPKTEADVLEITTQELEWLLKGLDFRRAHKTLKYDIL